MSVEQIAERYGRALFELGLETGELVTLTGQVRDLASTYESSGELRAALEDPSTNEGQRQGLVDDLAARVGLSSHAKNALLLLAKRRRLAALPDIAACLASLADERNGVVRATVTSAEPLSESYAAELVRQLEKSTARRVILEKRLDPSLIAGVITTIGDNTIDGSLSGRLREIENQLFQSS